MKNRKRSRLLAVIPMLVLGFLMPAGARAQSAAQPPASAEPKALNPAAAAFDVLIVRPLGLVVLPVGVAAFIPAALLTAPNGMDSLRAALEHFVTAPAQHVFTRPLGDF